MMKCQGFRLFLKIFTVLLAVCLLPASVLADAVVEDIELSTPPEYALPIDFSIPPAPKA